jgi:SAM-dependent methyltransferase
MTAAATALGGLLRAARSAPLARRLRALAGRPAPADGPEARLAALRLELLPNARGAAAARPLRGLSVLELGCGAGDICGAALGRGAARVVGVDRRAEAVARARARFPETRFPRARFLQGSWRDLPDERFDVILCLSALDGEPDLRALFGALAQALTPTGVLVLDCGVARGPGRRWQVVQRAGRLRRYPTFPLLLRELLKPYAGRLVGPSALRLGDRVPRYVFHCPLRRATALLVTGGAGGSMLALDLAERDVPLLSTDALVGSLHADPRYAWSPAAAAAKLPLPATGGAERVAAAGAAVAAAAPAAFVDLLLREAPVEAATFCITGEILRHAAVRAELVRRLRARGIRVWTVSPAG